MGDAHGGSAAYRAISASAAALAFAGLLAAGVLPAGATGRRIVVRQVNNDGSAPFGYRTDDERMQNIAQTFTAPEDAKLKSLSLWLGGGGTAIVKLYKVRQHAPLGKLLDTMRYRVTGSLSENTWHRLDVTPAIPVKGGGLYSFVLSVKGKGAMLSARGGGGYKEGRHYCLCPRWTGTDYDHDRYKWAAHQLIGDLGFKLRFRRAESSDS